MNKQAIIFLTLFSCILMLSIYYITTPIQEQQMVSLSSKSISELVESINKNIESKMEQQSKIIASSTLSNQEKKSALVKLDSLKKEQELGHQITASLSKCQYNSAVEVSGSIVKMIVESDETSKEKASDVIRCAYQVGGDTHLYEVTFLLK